MLKFEEVCTRMHIELEQIDTEKSENTWIAELLQAEFADRLGILQQMHCLMLFDIILGVLGAILLGLVTFTSMAQMNLDGTMQVFLQIILLLLIVMSALSLIFQSRHMQNFSKVPCTAFKTTFNPSRITDIANGVLKFRVLLSEPVYYRKTDTFLILARDGAVPFLIPFTACSVKFKAFAGTNSKLLTEVLKDVK